jgi:16S rRNA (uracil1498-N3)-methyltransferase
MHLFYFFETTAESARMDAEEARHCLKVLRHSPGDAVQGIDGKGNYYEGIISDFERNGARVKILKCVPNWNEPLARTTLYISVLHKPDRMEWLAEKAVELGVTAFIPFVSEHTLKSHFRRERLEKIMISAIKQSYRARLPHFPPNPVSLTDALRENTDNPLRFLAWCEAEKNISNWNAEMAQSTDVTFFIGPEGDFSPAEVAVAVESGVHIVSLGQARLRSETAAIHALSLIKHLRGA